MGRFRVCSRGGLCSHRRTPPRPLVVCPVPPPMKSLLCLLASLCLLPTVLALAAEADNFQVEPGFVSLFNGRDLTGWGYAATAEDFNGLTISPDGRYEVKDGVIRVNERVPRMI